MTKASSATNINVYVLCTYSVLFHMGWSMWERNVFPIWLLQVAGGSKDVVGYVMSVQGAVAVIAAPAFGSVLDLTQAFRGLVLATVAIAMGALGALAHVVERNRLDWRLYGAVCLWSVLLSAQGILTDSLLAATTDKGEERGWAFALKSTFWRLGAALGQVANLVIFAVEGDEWEARPMRFALHAGLCTCAMGAVSLLFLDHQTAIDRPPQHALAVRDGPTADLLANEAPSASCEADSAVAVAGRTQWQPRSCSPSTTWRTGSDMPSPPSSSHAAAVDAALRDESPQRAQTSSPSPGRVNEARSRAVGRSPQRQALRARWVLFSSVLVRVCGKGMVMRFNPILLADVHHLTPTVLAAVATTAQALSVGAPLACALLGRLIGPVHTIVAVRLIEPATFIALGLSPAMPPLAGRVASGGSLLLLLALPVGTRAMEKALLMDMTPPKARGRWNALESINRGSWAGSAAVGGFLVHHTGWLPAYVTAAALTVASVLIMSALLRGERRERATGIM
mmetsp:Transcript_21459/g.57690  ORF Transcript_21459/g.57690 Transcript_21459/m.57690 type:complete len:510 (-) Transcript_21459:1337-2866(-)